MLGLSGTELLLIGVFALIIFGPDKIPGIARTVGKYVRIFKRTQEDMERMVKAEIHSVDAEKSALSGPAPEGGNAPTEAAVGRPTAQSVFNGTTGSEEKGDEG